MHFRLKISACCVFILMLSQLGLAAPRRKKPVQQPTPAPVQETPAPPPRQLTPEEMPAVAPKVSYSNGQLAITAENSTLGDILNAVRKETGATLDMPAGIANERVAVQLGPGNPRDVLQQLFDGSKFDYIIVGAPTNPDAVTSIVLTARGAGGSSAPAMANNRQSYQPPPAYQPPPEPETNTSEPADDDESQAEPAPEPASPEPPVTPPTAAQPYSNQPKTPEELLKELQQMQQRQQQGQQQGQQQERPLRNPPPQ